MYPRSYFGNEIICKEDYQKPSENLTSFFMEFVFKSKKGQELITSLLWHCQICLEFFRWNEQIKSLTQCLSQYLLKFRREGHQKPRNEVGSLNLAKHLRLNQKPEVWTRNLPIHLQCLNTLENSLRVFKMTWFILTWF